MKRNMKLLQHHLEDVSWRVLEEYCDTVRSLIRRRAGVYALYRGNRLYYVGLAVNLMGRLKRHLKDRHRRLWDRFSVYLTLDDRNMKELESLLLRIAKPPGNKVAGKFAGSENFRSTLNKIMTEADADRRASILGGHLAERRRRAKTSRAKGVARLAGISDKSIQLRATYEGQHYWARLRRDGTIRYRGKTFRSPSAAGSAVVRGGCNGWRLWHYREGPRRWAPLSAMKQ